MQITVQELKDKMEKREDFLLLDVRSTGEYQQWNIPGSVNMPMQTLQSINAGKLTKDKQIVCLCAHGMRSQYAAQILKSEGFDAISVFGGMAAWNSVYDLVKLMPNDAKQNDASGVQTLASDTFNIYQIKRIGKGCLGYFINANGVGIVIDPSTHTNEFLSIAKNLDCTIKAVMDTHQHADHVSGSRRLREATNAQLFVNPADGYNFSGFTELKDKWKMTINGLEIEVLHTPGHTSGSTSLLVDNFLITGDTLFIDGVARPDLKDKAEEYAGHLYDTYQNKILNLSDKTTVIPAHTSHIGGFGEPISKDLAWIKKNNRILELSKPEFIKYVISNIPPKPYNYEDIIAANKGETEWTDDEIAELEFGANKCVLPTG